ncbi:putative uridine phosphorylase [Trichinella nativa]|uniref:Putative uridine phosphorylase n=1 Tax=Trichinella nativa TaxID=6335 RepID=A0A1Y3EGD9_9BILA|nr:putative uridine phosphorylase [Trichinella nativa]
MKQINNQNLSFNNDDNTSVLHFKFLKGNCTDNKPAILKHILGKRVRKPTHLDSSLNNELLKIATELNYNTVIGKTLCSNDFYEGQARLDGAFCDYSKEEKLQFLQKAHLKGVKNIEMESSCFSAFCTRANVRAAVICVTLLNRLEQDQIDAIDELEEWEQRPVNVVTQYIAHHFNDAYN